VLFVKRRKTDYPVSMGKKKRKCTIKNVSTQPSTGVKGENKLWGKKVKGTGYENTGGDRLETGGKKTGLARGGSVVKGGRGNQVSGAEWTRLS